MLHVTNGDSARVLIERSGLGGDVLPWRDVLHEGPVPGELPPDDLRRVRVRFLSRSGRPPEAVVAAELARRDEALADAAQREQVVLWFEHDLYDQLQLLQVLSGLEAAAVDRGRVSLICVDAVPGRPRFGGLGELEPAELTSLWPTRTGVTDEQYRLAATAWAAFRSPDPTAVEDVVAGDTAALPFLAAALRRHLEQFPWVGDGLSRSERALLAPLVQGPATAVELFAAQADAEEAPFLGDTVAWSYLAELASGPEPLLGPTSAVPRPGAPTVDRPLTLTALGRRVLVGQADRVAVRGVDRSLGGVRLRGREVWRWDPTAARLVAPSGT